MTGYDDAIKAASEHRAQFGDDVIQHFAVEYDGFMACFDCGSFVCESLDDYYEDDEDDEWGPAPPEDGQR